LKIARPYILLIFTLILYCNINKLYSFDVKQPNTISSETDSIYFIIFIDFREQCDNCPALLYQYIKENVNLINIPIYFSSNARSEKIFRQYAHEYLMMDTGFLFTSPQKFNAHIQDKLTNWGGLVINNNLVYATDCVNFFRFLKNNPNEGFQTDTFTIKNLPELYEFQSLNAFKIDSITHLISSQLFGAELFLLKGNDFSKHVNLMDSIDNPNFIKELDSILFGVKHQYNLSAIRDYYKKSRGKNFRSFEIKKVSINSNGLNLFLLYKSIAQDTITRSVHLLCQFDADFNLTSYSIETMDKIGYQNYMLFLDNVFDPLFLTHNEIILPIEPFYSKNFNQDTLKTFAKFKANKNGALDFIEALNVRVLKERFALLDSDQYFYNIGRGAFHGSNSDFLFLSTFLPFVQRINQTHSDTLVFGKNKEVSLMRLKQVYKENQMKVNFLNKGFESLDNILILSLEFDEYFLSLYNKKLELISRVQITEKIFPTSADLQGNKLIWSFQNISQPDKLFVCSKNISWLLNRRKP